MFALWDYSDIIDYLFKNMDAFQEEQKQDSPQKNILVSAHLLIQKILLAQIKNPNISYKKIFYKLKKSNTIIVCPGNYFQDTKQDILSIQDVLQQNIQFSFLGEYDKTFAFKYFDYKENKKQYLQFLASNNFYLNLLSQKLKEDIIQKYRVSQSSRVLNDFFKSGQLKNLSLRMPIILAFSQNDKKVIFKNRKNKIIFYDQKKFAEKLQIREHMLSQIMFWGLLIYCSSKLFTSESILKKITNKYSNDVENGYNKEMKQIGDQLIIILKYINKKDILEIHQEVLNFFSKLEIVNKMKMQKFFNFFTQCNLIYNPQVSFNQFFIIKKYINQQKIHQNNYFGQLGYFLKYNGFLPQDYSYLSHKYQKFFTLNQNKYYLESNELNYLQNIGFKTIVKTILENLIQLMCVKTPKKIILKQYYGQQFYNRIKPQILPFTNQYFIRKLNFNLLDSLENFYSSIKTPIKKFQELNYFKTQLLNLGFLYFFHQMGYINLFQNTINCYGQFLINLRQKENFHFGFMVLEFLKNDFFNEKSFIQLKKFTDTKPGILNKKYQTISDHEYFLYMGETFSQVLLKLVELMPKIMVQNSNRFHQEIWTILEQGTIKSNIKQQGFYRFIFYELFYNVIKFYDNNIKNKLKYDKIQFKIMSKMVSVKKNINFLTIIFILLNYSFSHPIIKDLSCEKIQNAIDFMYSQFNVLIKSNFLNLIYNQNLQFDNKTKELLQKIPFTRYQQENQALLVKKLFTLIHCFKYIKKEFPIATDQLKEIIYEISNELKKHYSIYDYLINAVQSLIQTFQNVGLQVYHQTFYQQLIENSLFLHESQKIFDKIIKNNQFIRIK